MLDYLKFENDEVFNYFVDTKNIEKVIVTDDNTAQELFRSPKTVPKNTKSAITPTLYTYNPPTRGNYTSYYLRKPDNLVNLLIPEQNLHRHIQSQEKEHKSQIAMLEEEKNEVIKDMKKLEAERKQFQENCNVLQEQRSQIMQKKQKIMLEKMEVESSQRTIGDIGK